MPRKPIRWTTCPECGRDPVGVQVAWNTSVHRRSNPRLFLIARHLRHDSATAWCLGGRAPVPESVVVSREGAHS